jgi:hypothetical protein
MADKVLQDPSKQRFFEQASMHELFVLPRKSYEERKRESAPSKVEESTPSLIEKRPKAGDAPEEDEEPLAKPSKMYKLNKRNVKRDEKA